MYQTDEIHESFYDLFNQRFHIINDPKTNKCHCYASVAIGAHSKPCEVHPNFKCIVVIRKQDLGQTPKPFLNRFEKYLLSHKTVYEELLFLQPPCLCSVIQVARKKVPK